MIQTSSKAIYEEELTSVPEDKAWYKLAFEKKEPLLETDGRMQFRGKKI